MESLKPELIILDLEMPEMNGIEFLKEKRRRQNNIPVLAFGLDEDDALLRAVSGEKIGTLITK